MPARKFLWSDLFATALAVIAALLAVNNLPDPERQLSVVGITLFAGAFLLCRIVESRNDADRIEAAERQRARADREREEAERTLIRNRLARRAFSLCNDTFSLIRDINRPLFDIQSEYWANVRSNVITFRRELEERDWVFNIVSSRINGLIISDTPTIEDIEFLAAHLMLIDELLQGNDIMNDDIDGDEAMKNLDDAMDKIFRKKPEDTEEIIADQEDEEVADD